MSATPVIPPSAATELGRFASRICDACYRTGVTEEGARIYWVARRVGTPQVLSAADSAAILDLEAERYRQKLLAQPNPA